MSMNIVGSLSKLYKHVGIMKLWFDNDNSYDMMLWAYVCVMIKKKVKTYRIMFEDFVRWCE